MIDRVGEAEKEGEAKERIPIINANAAVAETNRKVEKANAEQILKAPEIEISREINLEQIAAQRSAEQKNAKSRKVVEQRRAEMELESRRATTVTQAKIARDRGQQKADADAFTAIEKADAQQYNQQPGRRCCRRFDGAGSRIGRQPATVAQHHSRADRYDCAELVDAAAGSARLPAKNERGDVFFGEDGVENGSIGEDEYDQWAQVIYCSFWQARRSRFVSLRDTTGLTEFVQAVGVVLPSAFMQLCLFYLLSVACCSTNPDRCTHCEVASSRDEEYSILGSEPAGRGLRWTVHKTVARHSQMERARIDRKLSDVPIHHKPSRSRD